MKILMKLTPQERAVSRARGLHGDPEPYKRTCRNCGAPFQTRIAQQHICSERCRAKYAQRKHRSIERAMNTIIPCALITAAAVWILLPAAIIFWLVADILLTAVITHPVAVITHPVSWLLIIGTITSTLTWAITCRRIKLILTITALLLLESSVWAGTYRVHYSIRGSGRDITVQAESSAEARRTVMDTWLRGDRCPPDQMT
jgi:hypothetical protein